MDYSARRLLIFLCSLLSLCITLPSWAAEWTQPTPDELKMTSDSAAPDAPAVFLYREEIIDDKAHFHRVYARIKILNEKGKEEFSDIEIPYEAGGSNVRSVDGRTIHADGAVVPFTSKPWTKELEKSGGVKWMEKGFSMPDVQVGSILEYRYEIQYDDNWFEPPDWFLAQKVFTHKAHYHFVPTTRTNLVFRDAKGHEDAVNRLLYLPALPDGVRVREGMDGYDLVVDNVRALPQEEFEPPLGSFAYRLVFYYSPTFTGADFWKEAEKSWSKDVDRFANPSDRIRQAVAQIVAPGDTDEQKLRKIYTAVMTVENTRFTREHTAAENKAEGLKIKTAADIWEQKRGTDDEITRLFISMARAAGMKAYAMIVTERNRNLLNLGYLYWGQLEDEIAIVQVNGKEIYFDPGQRYCEYGKLHWMHTLMQGVRQTDGGPATAFTPGPTFKDNQTMQTAELTLGPEGTVSGQVRITMNGTDALRWRQEALRSDEQETKKRFEQELQERVPSGITIKTNHFIALTDPNSVLMAIVDVSGSVGTATGKHVILPSAFFEANSRPPFAEEKREAPVDLRYPYIRQDDVKLALPPGFTVDTLPKDAQIPYPKMATYATHYEQKDGVYRQQRVLVVGNTIYHAEEYGQLRDFFQKTSAQDQEQVLLKRGAALAAEAGVGGKSE